VDSRLGDGIYNLKILDATTKNAGRFECLVKEKESNANALAYYHAIDLKVYRRKKFRKLKWKPDAVFSLSKHLESTYRKKSDTVELNLIGPLPRDAFVSR